MPRDRRFDPLPDRRNLPRGGRRPTDLPGRYPPVLVADSYEGAREPCVEYLNLFKFEVAEVAHPAEAMALLDSGWTPQIILADADSAPALAQRIASQPGPSPTGLILLAASFEAVPSPAVGVLVKPFRLAVMLNTVRRVLRKQARLATTASLRFPSDGPPQYRKSR